jgi:hypothetical protein
MHQDSDIQHFHPHDLDHLKIPEPPANLMSVQNLELQIELQTEAQPVCSVDLTEVAGDKNVCKSMCIEALLACYQDVR